MDFIVIISLQINHTSLAFGLSLGVAGKLYGIVSWVGCEVKL